MNKKERDQIEQLLLEKKREIVRVLSEFVSESKEVDTGIAQDTGDKAESSYTKEFLLRLSDTERNQLTLIDEALGRLKRDEYDVCQNCGKEIGKKRLQAVPWAHYCIKCQELEEQGVL